MTGPHRRDWTPELVEYWLTRYRELLSLSTSGLGRSYRYTRERPSTVVRDPFEGIDRKADLDRAFGQLCELGRRPNTARGAGWMWEHLVYDVETADIAEREDRSQQWVNREIETATRRMAELLGWVNTNRRDPEKIDSFVSDDAYSR